MRRKEKKRQIIDVLRVTVYEANKASSETKNGISTFWLDFESSIRLRI